VGVFQRGHATNTLTGKPVTLDSDMDFGIWDQYRITELQRHSLAADLYDEHIRLVQIAEVVGFDHYYIIEHQSSYIGTIGSPSVLLTAIARETSKIRLGAMIWQLPFHNPLRLAQEVSMLDHLSHGRVEFGTGIGVHEHEFIRWGLDFYQRRQMTEEALDIIKMAWTQDSVTYEGKYWKFDEAIALPRPLQQPHPPIWSAVHSADSLDFAAKNNYDIATNIDTDIVVAEKFDYFRSKRREFGYVDPAPRTFLMRNIHVAETDELARQQAEPHLLVDYRLGREFTENTRIGFGSHARGAGTEDSADIRERGRVIRNSFKSFDFSIENGIAVVGSPTTVARKLAEQRELIGIDIYVGNFHLGTMPAAQIERSIRLFGEEVIPSFK
jgi:alkanesulfonate monooxygenase SsuD/methylene tetrahydromethanopterin reductase-like flavin-dependent oxidoreductase (luciferase family)